MIKIIRTSTIGLSLNTFCKGLLKELAEEGYEIIALSSPDNDLKEVGNTTGVKTIGIRIHRKIAPLRDLLSLIRLVRVFMKEKPDMVHSITPKAGLLSMVAAKIARVPVRLHTFTGLIFPTSRGFRRKLLVATDRITCLCASHIMAEGHGVKSDLIDNRVTEKEISVLGYGNIRGIDLDYYDRTYRVVEKASEIRNELIARSGISENSNTKPFIFIYIGRFVSDKGIDSLIDAFKRLLNEGKPAMLLLVGDFDVDDPLKSETMDYIKKSKNICLSGGWVKDVRPFLAAADALVFPSRREGFPNVVIEAGAMGLPSIVTDINGSNEIISDGINGTIVPPDDTGALTDAMRDFMTHKANTSKMALSARNIITERYEQSFVRTNLKNYYNKILSS